MTTYDSGIVQEMPEISSDEPRSLETLLKSTTYQGMTDEDIGRIIEYRCEQSYLDGYNAAREEYNEEQSKAMREHWQKQAETAEAAFNAAVMSAVHFQEV